VAGLGLEDISLTTNGQLLARKLPLLLLPASAGSMSPSIPSTPGVSPHCPWRRSGQRARRHGPGQRRRHGDQGQHGAVAWAEPRSGMPLLDYCLERGYELRFIELMRMGHLARDSNAFLQQFVRLEQLLELIGERHEFEQARCAGGCHGVRYRIPGKGISV
jgi:cyclic pyranopterin phosphate synthase